jgi:hypothetical protein
MSSGVTRPLDPTIAVAVSASVFCFEVSFCVMGSPFWLFDYLASPYKKTPSFRRGEQGVETVSN